MGTDQEGRALNIGLCLILIVALISITGCLDDALPAEQRNGGQATENKEGSSCAGIGDTLDRDICLWDAAVQQALMIPAEETSCAEITDPVLHYFCIRLFFRPHIAVFMPHRTGTQDPFSWTEPTISSECASGDFYKWQMCTLLTTFDKGRSKPETACEEFNQGMRGACQFLGAISLVMSSSSQEELTNRLQGFCPTIADGAWRSECYYLLADELASARPVGDISVIARACEDSYDCDVWDFHCSNHVVQLMPSEDGKRFCSELRQELQEACWMGWGREKARQSNSQNTESKEELCIELGSQWRNSCEEGILEFEREHPPPALEEGIEYGPTMK